MAQSEEEPFQFPERQSEETGAPRKKTAPGLVVGGDGENLGGRRACRMCRTYPEAKSPREKVWGGKVAAPLEVLVGKEG